MKYLNVIFILCLSLVVIAVAQDDIDTLNFENVESIELIGSLGDGNRHIALSPNGQLVATLNIKSATDNSEGEDRITIWNLSDQALISEIFIPGLVVETFEFHNNSKYIIIGSIWGEIVIWDVEIEQIISEWVAHESDVVIITQPLETDSVLATASSIAFGANEFNNFTLWDISDISNPQEIINYRSEFGSGIGTGLFYDDDIFFMSNGLQLDVWTNIENDVTQILTGHVSWITDMVWLPDFSELLTVGDYRLIAWDTDSMFNLSAPVYRGVISDTTFLQGPYAIYSVAVSGDGSIIFTGDSNGEIKIWDIETLNLIRTIDAHDSPVAQVRFNEANNTLISTAIATEEVKLWGLVE